MKVLQYLNDLLDIHQNPYWVLRQLENEYGIKSSISEKYKVVVLNYDQIDSDKNSEIVKECRSLVITLPVDYEEDNFYEPFEVVSRSFDRFFNYGEGNCKPNITKLNFYDKLDGSLVGIFFHKDQWMYRTRSVVMPTSLVDDVSGMTWDKLIEDAVGWESFLIMVRQGDFKDYTFILEVTSPYNRVVTAYDKPKAHLLAVRDKQGIYCAINKEAKMLYREIFGWALPGGYKFNSFKDCLDAQQARRNLEEGVVGYDDWGIPVCKVKNPAYVAAHHLRGEGVLSAKRIVNLININELDEYLSVFPKDFERVNPWKVAKEVLDNIVEYTYSSICNIEVQKEFALKAIEHPFSGILFNMRKGFTYKDSWDKLSEDSQVELIKTFIID